MVVHLSLATVSCLGAGAEWAELHFAGLGFCQVSKVEGRGAGPGSSRSMKQIGWCGIMESKSGKEEGEGISQVLNTVLVLESGSKNY